MEYARLTTLTYSWISIGREPLTGFIDETHMSSWLSPEAMLKPSVVDFLAKRRRVLTSRIPQRGRSFGCSAQVPAALGHSPRHHRGNRHRHFVLYSSPQKNISRIRNRARSGRPVSISTRSSSVRLLSMR
jgi:hypothetical protein